jgi:hypothetical protein
MSKLSEKWKKCGCKVCIVALYTSKFTQKIKESLYKSNKYKVVIN